MPRIVALLLASGLIVSTQGVRPFRLAVNMTTIESAPLIMAADGADASRLQLTAGGIAQLVSGQADAATNASTQAVLRSVESPNIRIVLTVSECSYRIVGRRSAGIRQAVDLRGKRVGTPANTSAHFFLVKMLGSAGLRESDVTIVPLAQSAMAGALQAREVDAVSIWEPWAQYAADAAGRDAVILQSRSLYRELFNLNTTTEVLAEPARRAALVALLRATIAASSRLGRGPGAAAPLLASRLDVKEATMAAVWQQFRFPASLPADLVSVLVEEEAWAASSQKRQPRSRAVLASLVDGSVLAEALKAPDDPGR